ncbi:helix-turn-helix domain-containing protein [Geovibrio ferrireducens]|uniref:helix-turn-helix domain-containing protein n=1 Tax=Geovibrio ferrireducens TaxID=46201 RepID=UPI002245724D|nr:DUF1804 family protein [Geovibrio ferrireducens]
MARMTKLQKEQLKNFYIDGMSVTDICASLNISRDTFYYHKKAMEKDGTDIESLRLSNLRSERNLAAKETEFLNTLILAFEAALKDIQEMTDPVKKLDTLTKYINAYYKLKAPKETDSKQAVIDAITGTIYEISQIAIEEENTHVISFLHENGNEIIERTLARKHK